jgi:PAS domain S-box-containing protein
VRPGTTIASVAVFRPPRRDFGSFEEAPVPDTTPLEQIDAIYRAAPIGLCVLDRELRYVRVNDRLARINGLPAAAHLGRRVGELLPEIADVLEPVLRRVLEAGDAIENVGISTPPPPAGSGRSVVMHCLPLCAGQKIVGINVVVEDITGAKQTAERLRSAERRLWLQTEHSPMAVIEWDADYRVTRWGGAAETIFGWKADEVLGLPIGKLNLVVEDDWPIVQETIRRLNSAENPHVVSRNRNYTRDGRTITCDWYNSVVRDPEGRLSSVLSLVLDVTEQRRVEIEQELLSAASEVLAVALDTDMAIERLLRLPIPQFADWCGLEILTGGGEIRPRGFAHRTPELELQLASLHRRVPFDAGSAAPSVEALRSGRSILVADFRHLDCQSIDERHLPLLNALAPVSLLCVPLRVEDRTLGVWTWGRSRQEAFTGRDLALAEELARRTATAILNAQLFEAVDRANRIKDQFLATLGHELRQPLSALTAAISLLGKTASSDASERVWSVASRQLNLITRLVDDLLDLSRIERGKVALQRQAIELNAVVRDAVDVNAHLFVDRGQRLTVAVPDAPVPIVGDAARLQQAISNLLSNASKFTPEGGSIDLTLEVHERQARISVRDTGRGIQRSQLDAIFEPFAQAGGGAGGGLGIGLAVVRQLVELHGGKVMADSEGEGRGSEFVVLLPLASAANVNA